MRITSYTYDNYNRLSNATANAFSRNYQYDEWGNVKNFSGLTLNYATNGSGAPSTNRLLSDSQGGSYSYDAAGNQTAGAGQSYSYDGANRLKEVGTGGANVYGYDGDGKRVKKTEGGSTTYYVHSSKLGQSVMEVSANSVQRAFIYSGNKIIALQATDGQFYWMHSNHIGNPRAMTDASGNLSYKAQFDPYGTALTEWSASGNTNLNSKKFTGYERDATGLDYANARMHNPSRGRFMTPDPIGLKGADTKRPESLNRYSYVQNDPVNFVDSTGNLLQAPDDVGSGGPCQSIFVVTNWATNQFTGERISYGFTYTSCVGVSGGGGGGGGGEPQTKVIHYLAPFDNPRSVLDSYLNRNPGCKNFLNSVKGALGSRSIDQVWDTIDHIRLGDPGPGAYAEVAVNEEGGFDITIQGFYVSGVQIGGVTIYTPPIPGTSIPGGSPKEVEHAYIKALLHEFMHIHDFFELKGHKPIVFAATQFLTDGENARVGKILLDGNLSEAAFSHALDAMIESRCPNN